MSKTVTADQIEEVAEALHERGAWNECDDAGCDKQAIRPDAMFCLEHMDYSPEELEEMEGDDD